MNKVTLLDKEFHFGIGFFSEIFDNTNITLADIFSKIQSNDISIYRTLMFYSLVYAAKRRNETIDFDIYYIDDLIDNNGGVDGEFLVSFAKAFIESVNKNVPVDEKKNKMTHPK